jgi:chromosome segregation ATPase
MKPSKNVFFLSLVFVGLLWSCDTKEKQQLLTKVDSLEIELHTSQQNAMVLQEIGVLIDSIDASRQLLRTNVVEGTSYTNYKERLADINRHIVETKKKIEELEQSMKTSAVNYSASIRRLKNDLKLSSEQVAALQTEVDKMRSENETLVLTVNEKETQLAEHKEVIQMREQDVAALETKVEEIHIQSQNTQANLYFAQAQALETAADRTKFAPKKKKETQREALELYRISLSLGNNDAQSRIAELEKELG